MQNLILRLQKQKPFGLLRKSKPFGLSLLFLSAAVFAYQQIGITSIINKKVLNYLISADKLSLHKKYDAVYVIGGGQESLKGKYKTLSEIYGKGGCKEIWILSLSGTTEFSRSLGRNLTNNEHRFSWHEIVP